MIVDLNEIFILCHVPTFGTVKPPPSKKSLVSAVCKIGINWTSMNCMEGDPTPTHSHTQNNIQVVHILYTQYHFFQYKACGDV
jgi:hypothetical protein